MIIIKITIMAWVIFAFSLLMFWIFWSDEDKKFYEATGHMRELGFWGNLVGHSFFVGVFGIVASVAWLLFGR